MKFIVDRKKWLRGTGFGLLYSKNRKSCCVGQFACQLGIKNPEILGHGTIEDYLDDFVVDRWQNNNRSKKYENRLRKLSCFLNEVDEEKDWLNEAYSINDSTEIDDKKRQIELTKLLKENGHTLKFIN